LAPAAAGRLLPHHVAIGEYEATEATGPAELPITYWSESQRPHRQLAESPQMLRWLVDLLGPYPFETAGVVVVPAASAMETQTMVTLGEGVLQDYEYGRTVVLHEYAHQWLGDAVTPDNWPDLWLNEGLTMYVQLLWEDHVGIRGVDATIAGWDPPRQRRPGWLRATRRLRRGRVGVGERVLLGRRHDAPHPAARRQRGLFLRTPCVGTGPPGVGEPRRLHRPLVGVDGGRPGSVR
jgi:hypothetical protein